MLTDKELKKEFKVVAGKNPEKYYPTDYLKQEGFSRGKCIKCSKYFWSTNKNQDVCGDASCSGGFRFIGNTPAKNKLSYIDVWKKFAFMFKKFNYAEVKRYPVVARWNPTTDFTIASISAFQPFVVSGEVKPPANPLVIPQFCLRFNDVDNVGITAAHNTGFIMIGQHMFAQPHEWDQNKLFGEIHNWLRKGLGLADSEVVFHEDAWAGGGNFGSCMEFFSRGTELGNQVYMTYEHTQYGNKELRIKVLDMGMGQERNAWFSQGTGTIYDAAFPKVMKNLYNISGLKSDDQFMRRYVPYAGYLNADESENMENSWKFVAKSIGLNLDELKKKIIPLSALYSIGEHTRSLLVALNDGALPSNVGGGYNLRILARRCFDFIEKYKWDVYLPELCEEHARELKPQYPELTQNLADVKKILDVEREKYRATRQKAEHIIEKIVKEKQKINTSKLVELYDSHGISPEIIAEKTKVKVPDNFYALVAERHESSVQEHQTKKGDIAGFDDVPATQAIYYQDYKLSEFRGKVLRVAGNKIALDKTAFYPTSGGQLHDVGTLNGYRVLDVFKQGNAIIHLLDNGHGIKENEPVAGKIDYVRRIQLAQHHTGTHIINAAARRVLGSHVNQASAKKAVEKAHIDITHYQSLTNEELKKIEDEANKIISQGIAVKKSFMLREAAEKEFGFTIYQGGVPIGKELRIVNIVGVDVEACGGTHLDNTKEAEKIKILKSTKISDSVVRIEFVAGKRAFEEEDKEKEIIHDLSSLLNCKKEQIPGRLDELFKLWKDTVKKKKHLDEFGLSSTVVYTGEVIEKSAEILKTQPEHLVSTAKRFIKEIKEKIS